MQLLFSIATRCACLLSFLSNTHLRPCTHPLQYGLKWLMSNGEWWQWWWRWRWRLLAAESLWRHQVSAASLLYWETLQRMSFNTHTYAFGDKRFVLEQLTALFKSAVILALASTSCNSSGCCKWFQPAAYTAVGGTLQLVVDTVSNRFFLFVFWFS